VWRRPRVSVVVPAGWGSAFPPRPPCTPAIPAPTSSSLFKVLEASADVIPAFRDWTRDCGKETQFTNPAECGVSLPRPFGVSLAIKHLGGTPTPERGGCWLQGLAAGTAQLPVMPVLQSAVQWDWNQFSSLRHSQLSPNGAEPLEVCLRRRGDHGGGHLPWPAGSQGQRRGE